MFNFEEEILRFTPSVEISEAEERALNTKKLDITDILEDLLKEKKQK